MLTLTAREIGDRIPREGECITPDRLVGLRPAEIEKLPLLHGNVETKLADHFRVTGDPADGCLRILGDVTSIKRIGSRMTTGSILVDGAVGMHLGAEMSGGRIEVLGDADDWAGAEMKGGQIRIRGNAGHLVGAAYRGESVGMRGGEILVHGNAGDEVGASMRRGFIAVGGKVGDFAGASMIAGSIFVFGEMGVRVGAGMRRGTIAVLGPRDVPTLLPTFRESGVFEPVFLRVYLAALQQRSFPPATAHAKATRVRRFIGDLLELGKGEILAAMP
ncbi:MAG: formylmethanofuran dehydrogenase subunit C [Planctomycetota bacterium]